MRHGTGMGRGMGAWHGAHEPTLSLCFAANRQRLAVGSAAVWMARAPTPSSQVELPHQPSNLQPEDVTHHEPGQPTHGNPCRGHHIGGRGTTTPDLASSEPHQPRRCLGRRKLPLQITPGAPARFWSGFRFLRPTSRRGVPSTWHVSGTPGLAWRWLSAAHPARHLICPGLAPFLRMRLCPPLPRIPRFRVAVRQLRRLVDLFGTLSRQTPSRRFPFSNRVRRSKD